MDARGHHTPAAVSGHEGGAALALCGCWSRGPTNTRCASLSLGLPRVDGTPRECAQDPPRTPRGGSPLHQPFRAAYFIEGSYTLGVSPLEAASWAKEHRATPPFLPRATQTGALG